VKTAAFYLEDDQIDWLYREGKRLGGTSGSAIIRRLITEEMNATAQLHPQSTTTAQATHIRPQPGEKGLQAA
jgi:hypothetical protein